MFNIPQAFYYEAVTAYLVFVVIISIPFGYLRRRYPRYSRPWARCLYIPILINIILRRVVGLSYGTIPFIVGAFVLGQFIGGKMSEGMAEETPWSVENKK
jgi:MFS family permease